METNPYAYDKAVPWMPQQHQLYADKYVTANTSQQFSKLEHQRLQHRGGEHSPKPAERMSKAQVLELARTFKRWLVLVSLMSFGIFSGLVAYHQVGTTANQTNQAPSDSSQETPATSSSSHDFFNQQRGTNFGSSNPSQGAFTGSHTS